MTTAETLQLLTLVTAVLAGCCIPLALRKLDRQNLDRHSLRQELHERLDHLDQCLDETKRIVIGEMITRDELKNFKMEIQETLSRMREAIGRETNGLHERLMRVESKFIGGDDD